MASASRFHSLNEPSRPVASRSVEAGLRGLPWVSSTGGKVEDEGVEVESGAAVTVDAETDAEADADAEGVAELCDGAEELEGAW